MSGRSFHSMLMVASCAGAALGCYLISLRVASERAALEDVEQKIVLAQRDIRVLQTEIGTRGRLAQLEKWNVKVLALSAPSADQFLEGGFALARLAQPQDRIDLETPVVLAAAPAPDAQRAPLDREAASEDGETPRDLMRQASLTMPEREAAPAKKVPAAKPPAKTAAPTAMAAKAPAVVPTPASRPKKKIVDNQRLAAAKPVTKPVRIANADPLAPLTETSGSTAKDSGSAR